MGLTYAIADLHGRYDLLEEAYAAIRVHSNCAQQKYGTIIHLGDYVDRGPESRQIVEALMRPLNDLWNGWTRIALQGNHEDIMLLAAKDRTHLGWWLDNGGGATLMSYGQKDGDVADPGRIPREHLEWLRALPLMHIDRHRIFVHAGVVSFEPLDKQTWLVDVHGNRKIQWKLYPPEDEGGHGYYHVVHGHHQFENGPILKKGRTNLDTYAWYTGRLVVGVFDDDIPGGPVDKITVVGEHYSEIRARLLKAGAIRQEEQEA